MLNLLTKQKLFVLQKKVYFFQQIHEFLLKMNIRSNFLIDNFLLYTNLRFIYESSSYVTFFEGENVKLINIVHTKEKTGPLRSL